MPPALIIILANVTVLEKVELLTEIIDGKK